MDPEATWRAGICCDAEWHRWPISHWTVENEKAPRTTQPGFSKNHFGMYLVARVERKADTEVLLPGGTFRATLSKTIHRRMQSLFAFSPWLPEDAFRHAVTRDLVMRVLIALGGFLAVTNAAMAADVYGPPPAPSPVYSPPPHYAPPLPPRIRWTYELASDSLGVPSVKHEKIAIDARS
jgi:hypothetical protein